MQLLRSHYLTWIFYLTLACLSGWLGHLSITPQTTKSKIIVPLEPPKDPDDTIILSLVDEPIRFLDRADEAVLIREKSAGQADTLYFCPRAPDKEATLIVRFPLPQSSSLQTALLSMRLHSFYEFDPDARLSLSVGSPGSENREILLAEFSIYTEENEIANAFNITQYCKDQKELRIIIRGSARRLLYHPTPNDPIGYAGAQLLRQPVTLSWAMKLDLWNSK